MLAYRMLIAGWSAQSVGDRLGVSASIVKFWGTLAGMKFVMGASGGVSQMPMGHRVGVGAGRSYRRLTLRDRVVIQTLRETDPAVSVREIARRVGVHASTVSRELRAHAVIHPGGVGYDAELAHYLALARRPRVRAGKLSDPALREGVVSRLNEKFSPQQVAGELRLMFPDDPEMQVSHETIYQALYVQGRGALRDELRVEKALRSGRTGRKPQSKLPARTNRPWLEGAKLADRPAQAADRAVAGHWEGDLVVGPGNSGIVTLVERRSRLTLLGRLPGTRDSTTVTEVLQHMIQDLPAALKQTITWDQGTEMAAHAQFTIKTGCEVFFCDPHSPWQRPSNENTNGLIRDFYPKGTNFNTITDEDLAHTQYLLNIRPRRIHGYRSPAAIMGEVLTGVALTP